MTCDTCRFNTKEGTCRRFPPVLIPDLMVTAWQWPVVRDHDWCGEWKEKDGTRRSGK